MRVLVTGGTGFIGRYVIAALEGAGHTPVILDRRDRWPHAGLRAYETIFGDVTSPVQVYEAVSTVDGVIHLAAILGTQETIHRPHGAVEVNIGGSLNVFRACKARQVPAVYITVGNHWMQNPYAITKTAAERFAWMFNREHGTKIAVVRALNAYGPGQAEKPVRKILPSFIGRALRGEPIEVYGDGKQIMDMIHARDVADILVRALTVDHGNYEEAFEAGTGFRFTVREIAEMVIHAVGAGEIRHLPMRPGEPDHAIVLGKPETLRPLYPGKEWQDAEPFVTLEDGIAETVQAMRSAQAVGRL